MAPSINSYIDHTLLRSDARRDEILRLCREARQFQFYAVCVNGAHVELAASELRESAVLVASVVGFPLGAMKTAVKAAEAVEAVRDGAKEIDVVSRIDLALDGDWKRYTGDLAGVVRAAGDVPVKAILETGLLLDLQRISDASKAAVDAGVAFIKTSTGFFGAGATEEAILAMRDASQGRVKIKASGGIRTTADAEKFIALGVHRIGTSQGVNIVNHGTHTELGSY